MIKQQSIKQRTAVFAAATLFASLSLTGCQMVLPSSVTESLMRDGTQRSAVSRAPHAQPTHRSARRLAQNASRKTPEQGIPKNQPPSKPVANGQGEIQTVAYQMPDQNSNNGAPIYEGNDQTPLAAPTDWSEEMAYPMAQDSTAMQIYESGPGTFRSNAVQTLPQSATEKLIQLSGEMMMMRQEMQVLQQAVQELRNEKAELLQIRQELNTRLNSMEARLEEALETKQTPNRNMTT